MMATIRRFEPRDVAAAHALQCRAYPRDLHDSAAAFESRLAFADGLSLIAETDGSLAGYILAHPWATGSPPPVDRVLTRPRAGALVHYVHDLTVAPEARGTGLSQRLFDASAARAEALGFGRTELVAVRGASAFWARLGFFAVDVGPALHEKLLGYGADAVFMAR